MYAEFMAVPQMVRLVVDVVDSDSVYESMFP
jgi:hypothetical protein